MEFPPDILLNFCFSILLLNVDGCLLLPLLLLLLVVLTSCTFFNNIGCEWTGGACGGFSSSRAEPDFVFTISRPPLYRLVGHADRNLTATTMDHHVYHLFEYNRLEHETVNANGVDESMKFASGLQSWKTFPLLLLLHITNRVTLTLTPGMYIHSFLSDLGGGGGGGGGLTMSTGHFA
ncbi:hypothetical protein ACLOJK_040825 [Asimina triloba]